MNSMDSLRGFDDVIRAQLSLTESLLSVTELRVPKKRTAATSFFSVVVFVSLYDEVRNHFRLRATRGRFADVPFPISRHMSVCITEERLLVWRFRVCLPRRFLGSIERERVRAMQLERSTHVNWSVITLEIDEDRQIRLLIDQPTAWNFAKTLNAGRTDPESA